MTCVWYNRDTLDKGFEENLSKLPIGLEMPIRTMIFMIYVGIVTQIMLCGLKIFTSDSLDNDERNKLWIEFVDRSSSGIYFMVCTLSLAVAIFSIIGIYLKSKFYKETSEKKE